jgi:hypothetical protein
MNVFQPWQLILVTLAGWINRQQQDVVAYIREEDRILRNKFKGERIRFTDDERRRLTVKGRVLGRKILRKVVSIVGHRLALGDQHIRLTQLVDDLFRRIPFPAHDLPSSIHG